MLLCVDNGFDTTKVKTRDNIYKFPSRFEKADGNELDKDVLEYFGERWVNRGPDDINNDKTKSIIHKLCTLKALAMATEEKQNFDLIVDLPLIHYKNTDFREEFKDYISNPKYNFLRYQGKPKEIIINSCKVVPQGLASLYAYDPGEYKNKVVGIIDIGGLTIDGCIVEDLKPIKETIFTINLGTKILENRIKTALNERLFLNIQDYEVFMIIKNGVPGQEDESKRIINEIFNTHLSALIREMKAKNWSIETLEILVVGGGAIRFKRLLNQYFNNVTICKNPVYANVLGLYNIGMMLK